VRAVSVHADVVVVTSQVWQTTCIAVRSGEEAFVIDSPVLGEELEALPALLAQAGFPVTGLLATHADWDHLLGRLAFPAAALGVAETTAARAARETAAVSSASSSSTGVFPASTGAAGAFGWGTCFSSFFMLRLSVLEGDGHIRAA